MADFVFCNDLPVSDREIYGRLIASGRAADGAFSPTRQPYLEIDSARTRTPSPDGSAHSRIARVTSRLNLALV